MPGRKLRQFLMKDFAGVVWDLLVEEGRRRPRGFTFASPAPQRAGSGGGRDAVGHAVEPGSQRIIHAKRPSLACQDQEGRLERILSVVMVAENAPADVQHHCAVSAYKRREGNFRVSVAPRIARRAGGPSIR